MKRLFTNAARQLSRDLLVLDRLDSWWVFFWIFRNIFIRFSNRSQFFFPQLNVNKEVKDGDQPSLTTAIVLFFSPFRKVRRLLLSTAAAKCQFNYGWVCDKGFDVPASWRGAQCNSSHFLSLCCHFAVAAIKSTKERSRSEWATQTRLSQKLDGSLFLCI